MLKAFFKCNKNKSSIYNSKYKYVPLFIKQQLKCEYFNLCVTTCFSKHHFYLKYFSKRNTYKK